MAGIRKQPRKDGTFQGWYRNWQGKRVYFAGTELPYGHWVNIEAPVEVAELIDGFVT